MKGTACITGASSGIGRAYALALAEAGYRLIITGRRQEKLQEVIAAAEQLRGRVEDNGQPDEIFIGDLTDPEVCAMLTGRLAATTDLDVLIHNAGFGHQTDFFETSPSDLRQMGEIHMQSAVVLIRSAIPRLATRASLGTEARETGARDVRTESGRREWGAKRRRTPAVVLVSSVAAFAPAPGPAMYTSTKAFLVSFGRAVHPAAARAGVRVQVLCPGFTHTDFHDRLGWSAERRHDRGIVRWMTAEEVVRRSLRDLDRSRRRLWRDPVYVPGGYNRLIVTALRWIPRPLFARIAARSFSFAEER